MKNIAEMRAGLKAAIDKIEGLTAEDLRPNPNVPCAIVIPHGPFKLNTDFDGEQWPLFRVLILCPYVNTSNGQDQLDAYLAFDGPQSVKQAIENDTNLKSIVSEVIVEEMTSYGVLSLNDGGTEYLAGELLVEVYT